MRSLISVRELEKEDVGELLKTARNFKDGGEEALKGDVALLFLEPSTRTRVSFEKACRNLSLNTYTVLGESSSLSKGESFLDTLKTFEALGFRAVIFRVPFVLFPYEELTRSLDLSLINAGDATHQHPTQGLIDLMTLQEAYDSLEGLKVLYVGDILHSRVFRSGVHLLKLVGARVSVCGPATLIPRDIHVFGVEEVFTSVDEGIEWADAVIWLRLQRERQKENFIPSERSYFEQFGLTRDRYKRLKGYFMHPGPVNREIDIDGTLMYSERSLIQDQVKNGLFVRMAVLSWCLR
ncbi:aspartate carbamoyltransferase catalytic subunit [Hydrogenivirga sp.]